MPKVNISRHLGEVLDHLPDAVVVTDDYGAIIWVNSQVEKAFGYEPRELVGVSIEKLMDPALRVAHVKHRAAYFSHPTRRPMGTGMPIRARRKDGSEFPVDISLNPFHVGKGLFVAATVREMPDWQHVEMQLSTAEGLAQMMIKIIAQAESSVRRADQTVPSPYAKDLSPRETSILRLLAEGKSNKDVAAILSLSVKTVETYRARVLHKLHVNSLVKLVHYAIRHKIVTP